MPLPCMCDPDDYAYAMKWASGQAVDAGKLAPVLRRIADFFDPASLPRGAGPTDTERLNKLAQVWSEEASAELHLTCEARFNKDAKQWERRVSVEKLDDSEWFYGQSEPRLMIDPERTDFAAMLREAIDNGFPSPSEKQP